MPGPTARLLPRAVKSRLRPVYERLRYGTRVRAEMSADARRFRKYAQPLEVSGLSLTSTQLEAQITRDYHRIEKGLALPAPKRPFGESPLRRLNHYLPQAEARFPHAPWVRAGLAARDALEAWNSTGRIDDKVAPRSSSAAGDSIFESRHSVRDFSPVPVPRDLLHDAVRLASYSPSVCNREPWRIYFFVSEEAREILSWQNGNAGFRDVVPVVALVSVELGHFAKVGERNQAFIEGGIFATSLVYALHTLGLGSCMLNLSLTTDRLDSLRSAAGVPQSEVPIMMIAIGYPSPDHRYAASLRRTPADIIVRE